MDKRLFRILLILGLVSLAGGALLYPTLPDYVPTHWNMYGEVDGFSQKPIVFFLLSIPLLTALGLRLLPVLDPRGKNHHKSPRAYNVISAVTVLALMALGWITFLPGLGIYLPVEKLIFGAIGILFIVMGNFMPQVRSNFFLGVRTPWALSDDTVWRKTNRLGGIVFCIFGVLMILDLFIPTGPLQSLPFVFLLPAFVGVYVYSYVIYKRLPKGGQGPGPAE